MRTLETIRRFRLSDTFIEPYKDTEVPWGPLLFFVCWLLFLLQEVYWQEKNANTYNNRGFDNDYKE